MLLIPVALLLVIIGLLTKTCKRLKDDISLIEEDRSRLIKLHDKQTSEYNESFNQLKRLHLQTIDDYENTWRVQENTLMELEAKIKKLKLKRLAKSKTSKKFTI